MSEWIVWFLFVPMLIYVFVDIQFAVFHERIHRFTARRLSKKYKHYLYEEGLKFEEEGFGHRSYTFYIMHYDEDLVTFKNKVSREKENELRKKLFRKNKDAVLFLLAPCFPIIGLFILSSFLIFISEQSVYLELLLLIFNSLCCTVVMANYLPCRLRKLNRKSDGLQLKELSLPLYLMSAGIIILLLTFALIAEYFCLINKYI